MLMLVKVLRDLWTTRGRAGFMVLAFAAGLASLGGVLAMRGVLSREMNRSYLETIPASASFDLGERGLTDALLEELRARPEVAAAERRATRRARWRAPGETRWGRALLFVVEDFDDQQLALLGYESGERAPPVGSVLLERSALSVIGAGVGDHVEMSTSSGRVVELRIAGVVHEPALAPAVTERAGYFYASPETLALLEGESVLSEVRVLVEREPLEADAVEAQVETIAAWLSSRGVEIHEVNVPPPGLHPHSAPSEAVLLLFSLFAGLTVLLAALLCASLLSTTMARQAREIAVMKTLGASSVQIAGMYVIMLSLIALLALLVSLLPTWVLARAGIDAVASMLNIDIASYRVPGWVWAVQISTGISLPLLAAAPSIRRASRVSVCEALSDHGARLPRPWLARRIDGLDNRALKAALRNALRVPKRSRLTVGLLAVGGGLFVCAMSVADGWEAMTEEVFETRHYDVELHLAESVSPSLPEQLEGIERAEAWGFAPVTLRSASGLPLSRTYPDGGHGSFALVGVPDATALVDFDLRSGRWLRAYDDDEIVLNQLAASRLGRGEVGDHVELVVEGRSASWRVVGVVEEVAAPATAYVRAVSFVQRTGQPIRGLRVATGAARRTPASRFAVDAIEQQLSESGVNIVSTQPLELLFNAMGEHVALLIWCLLLLASLMAFVGGLALSSSMSTSVLERTREIGVLQAIGARPRDIRRMVLIESLFLTSLSLPSALLLAVPLTALVGQIVGRLSFDLALPLDLSWTAVAVWSAGSFFVAALASLAPARAATRLTVREALSHL